jgi:hypothetical protein
MAVSERWGVIALLKKVAAILPGKIQESRGIRAGPVRAAEGRAGENDGFTNPILLS